MKLAYNPLRIFFLCLLLISPIPTYLGAQSNVLFADHVIKSLEPKWVNTKNIMTCDSFESKLKALFFESNLNFAVLFIHADISAKGKVSKTRIELQDIIGIVQKMPEGLKKELRSILKSDCFLNAWIPAKENGINRKYSVSYAITFNPLEEEIIQIPPPKTPTIPSPETTPAPPAPAPEKIVSIEHYPEFVGGHDSFLRYIDKHFTKPAEAVKHEIVGRVLISFIVNEDGTLSDIKPMLPLSRQLGYGIEEAMVEVFANMPPWTPAYQRNKAVKVRWTQPVMIK